jgi:hypothetical protein
MGGESPDLLKLEMGKSSFDSYIKIYSVFK